MKRLQFCYNMEIRFDVPVHEHHFTLKCLPHSDGKQIVERSDYIISPYFYLSRSKDQFDNEIIYGSLKDEHVLFGVRVNGIVITEHTENIDETYRMSDHVFRYQTGQTLPGKAITGFYKVLEQEYMYSFEKDEPVKTFHKAVFFMERLHDVLEYKRDVTMITTTAEEAFSIGEGVCQDYAQILLSLLRLAGISCRYVTGMMTGEGLSHAWVEAYTEKGWIGLDPTNDAITCEDHISIAKGRDYSDCLINRGVFTGCGKKAFQTQTVSVEVKELGECAD